MERDAAVHLLGIRHHGPGSARSVVAALSELRPDIVLVEAPADSEPLLDWIGSTDLVPPVALLGWDVAEPARAAFAPFATFSPEWQAVRWAAAHGVAVRAIDLPLAVTMATRDAGAGGSDAGGSDASDAGDAGDAPVDPLRALAEAAGDPDPERWWEDVIEHRGDGNPAFEAVAEAMAAAREGSATSLREARREAHMRQAIRAARAEGHRCVAVVCGAWHVPALDVDAVPAASDRAALRGLPKVKVGLAWVPWSHRRLARATGYGAGIESPGWYAHVFDHPGRDGVARFYVDAARALRARGLAASPDHLIAGARLADTLAAMRDRPRPGLAEVLDAADAVMGGLNVLHAELIVGDALGEVPAGAPQVPLARDLAAGQRGVRLRPEPGERVVELDLRRPIGLRRSHLLHRLLALGITWGVPAEGRGSSGTFRETWRLSWDPDLAVRIVECSAYGTTVEAAATARLIERGAESAGLAELVGVLQQALLADLPAAVAPSVRRLADRAATDPDVGRLMDAAVPLAGALRYGNVRGTDTEALAGTFDGIVVRVIAGVVPVCRSLDDDAAGAMVERLAGVQAALATLDHPARHGAFPDVLLELADQARGHGLVQGRATRLLHDGGQWASVDVERRLGRALSPGTPPSTGASFVEGFLAGAGTVLVHDRELLAIVDRWLSSLAPDAFEAVVALLRRTFGGFEPAERRQIMALLGGRPSADAGGFGPEIDEARAALALRTVRLALGLPLPDGGDRAAGGTMSLATPIGPATGATSATSSAGVVAP